MKTSSECEVRQEEGRQPTVHQNKEDVPINTAAVEVSLSQKIKRPETVIEAAIAAVRVPPGTTTTKC